MRIFLFYCCFLTAIFSQGQSNSFTAKPIKSDLALPQDYFKNPLEIPLVLSGTFGELRSNHFHSGLDIKTAGKTGLNVFATAEGYIKRIKVAHGGYGKALYIQHPNGYISVYAHLKNFSPKIEKYIKALQYKKEKYQIEVYPEANELPVQQQEIIAYSGNTGGSFGPHLHFEIRDKQSRPMNPMLFGITVPDSRKPILNSLWVYPLVQNKDGHVNEQQEKQKLPLILQKDGSYKTAALTACGTIGFGVSTVDKLNGAPNKNGTYRITTAVNGSPHFKIVMDRFSFSESRYINRLIDYSYFRNFKSRIQKLFIEKNNPLSIYKEHTNKGFIEVREGLNYNYDIEITDFSNNTVTVRVPINGTSSKDINRTSTTKTPYLAKPKENFTYEENGNAIFIPKGALYDKTYLDIKNSGDTLHIHKEGTPLHKRMTVSIDVSNLKPEDKEKMSIAEVLKDNTLDYLKTSKKEKRFSMKTKSFGKYILAMDTIAPTIKAVNFKENQWLSNNRYLIVKIKDEESGIKSYKGTVNGKFILMEYDYKKGTLTHDFNDNKVNSTENKFQIIVLDNLGNSTTFECTFFRKNK